MSSKTVTTTDIPANELEFSAIRASGPGGQNVNKVATAVHLRFDFRHSSLSETIKQRLSQLSDSRITSDGIIIIKARRYRSQDKNRLDALARLDQLLEQAQFRAKTRKKSKPSKASKLRIQENKRRRGQRKQSRKKVDLDS